MPVLITAVKVQWIITVPSVSTFASNSSLTFGSTLMEGLTVYVKTCSLVETEFLCTIANMKQIYELLQAIISVIQIEFIFSNFFNLINGRVHNSYSCSVSMTIAELRRASLGKLFNKLHSTGKPSHSNCFSWA